MRIAAFREKVAESIPFYYGWVIFAVMGIASYSSRPMMAVATLSIFMVPMTAELGWTRSQFSGAVSLGGIFAVGFTPLVGWWVDRHGASSVVALGGLITGICAVGLSSVSSPGVFYLLYVPGRMAFASLLELGPSTSLSNWFVTQRASVLGYLGVTHGTGLATMPLVAQLLIHKWNWETAWLVLGIYTLCIAVLPAVLFIARRPEDMNITLEKNSPPYNPNNTKELTPSSNRPLGQFEINYSLQQALHTRAFWFLAIFSATGFMVQAGVSLHQAGHYIEQGLNPTTAAITVSCFALSQVPGAVLWAYSAKMIPVRFLLAMSGFLIATGAVGTSSSNSFIAAMLAATSLGLGVGGIHTLLRLAWANYYGRTHLGSIRGVTLPVQIAGQACGPIIAGLMYDSWNNYQYPFVFFAIAVTLGSILVLGATPPSIQTKCKSDIE